MKKDVEAVDDRQPHCLALVRLVTWPVTWYGVLTRGIFFFTLYNLFCIFHIFFTNWFSRFLFQLKKWEQNNYLFIFCCNFLFIFFPFFFYLAEKPFAGKTNFVRRLFWLTAARCSTWVRHLGATSLWNRARTLTLSATVTSSGANTPHKVENITTLWTRTRGRT